MNIYAFFSLLAAISNLLLGVWIYFKAPKENLNKIFLYMSLVATWLAFVEFEMRTSESYETAYMWIKLAFPWSFIFVLNLHFCLIFIGRTRFLSKKISIVIFYLPPTLLSILELTTKTLVTGVEKVPWGWKEIIANNIFIDILFFGILFISFLAVYLLIKFYFKTTDPLKKKQAFYLSVGYSIFLVFLVVTELVFRGIELKFPELGNSIGLVNNAFIAYAVWKFKLFDLSPTTASNDLIETISDSIVLVDNTEKIVYTNTSTQKLFGLEQNELLGNNINILLNSDVIEEIFIKKSVTNLETVYQFNNKSILPFLLSSSQIIDKIGTIQGLVCVIHDISKRKEAEKKLEFAFAETQEKNQELQASQEELRQANDELHAMLNTVNHQKEEIISQRDDIEAKNIELEKLSIVAAKTDNSVLIADHTGEIEWVNDGFTGLLGVSLDEFKENYGSNIYKTSLNPEIEILVQQSIDRNESVVYTNKTATKKGKEIWIQTTLTPILGTDGKLSKLVAIDSDITKIKKAEYEIIKQRDKLHLQNKHITDSINYAKKIQTAVLPSEEVLRKILPQHFILFKPLNIVSGDFYWIQKVKENVLIAAVDCTGHGVPGAFMSMLGISFLNEIVQNGEEIQPNKILEKLRNRVKLTLGQTGKKDESKDGMDIALCVINKKTNILQFSGAYNPLYFIRKKELSEIKASRNPIGIFMKEKPFANNEIELQKDDILYMFSDGFPDQFGGEKGVKLKPNRFKELLLSISDKPMQEQQQILNKEFENWRGNIEQIDDMLVVGVKI